MRPLPAVNQIPALPVLQNWQFAVEDMTTLLLHSVPQPLDFASFGENFGYLLYAAEMESSSARTTTLILPELQDPARVYLNGREVALIRDLATTGLTVPLQPGKNTVHLLIQNMGRYNYSALLGEPKGLAGSVYFDARIDDIRRGWRLDNGDTVNLDEVLALEGTPVLQKGFDNDGFDRVILTGMVNQGLRVNGQPIAFGEHYSAWNFYALDLTTAVKQGKT